MSHFLSIRDRARTATLSSTGSSNYVTPRQNSSPSSLAFPLPSSTSLRLSAFPQDVTLRIFSFLPLKSLGQLACCSRRLKVMAYNDVLYERKFRVWYYVLPNSPSTKIPDGSESTFVPTSPPSSSSTSSAASASLRPIPLDPKKIPLHISDSWARLAPSILSCATTKIGGMVVPASMGLPGQQAREAFRRIHSILWPYYNEFRYGSTAATAKIMEKSDPVDQAMYFALVKQFGRAAIVDDFATINEQVQTGLQVFESQLLSSFDRHYDGNDISGMQNLAKCLFFLTGGDSCVQLFIYKSPIFFDHVKDVTENFKSLPTIPKHPSTVTSSNRVSTSSPADSAFTHSSVNSPNGNGMGISQVDHDLGEVASSPLQIYLDTLSATLETQLPLIRTVFPHANASQYAFVSKVFDECILDYLTRLLREAQSRDLSVFLMSLTLMFEHCSALIRQLADHHGLNAAILEEYLHTTLSPFTGDEYMSRELSHLKTTYAKHLDTWSTTLAAQRANIMGRGDVTVAVPDPNLGSRVLSSVKNVLLTPSVLMQRVVNRGGDKYMPTLALTGSTPASPTDIGLYSPTVPGVVRPGGFDQLDSLLSVDMVLAMISINKESVKRCVVMMKRTGGVKKYVERLFTVLVQTIGEKHIRVSFEIATNRLSSYKASEDLEVIPLIQFFAMIQVVDVILQMVHLYFTEEMGQFVNLNDFLSDSIQEKKNFENVIDDCVATGLDRAMITLMSQSEFLLFTEQHPSDFEPPDDIMTDTRPTDACRLTVACLEKHIEMLRACAERNILTVFLAEVGSRFFTVLCKHIKRQRVSIAGGFRLMCDVNAYHYWAETLRNGEVSRMFKALKELVNIYIVTDLPALKQLVKDQNRFVGVFRVEDVYEFIERRSDYDRIKSKVKESECSIM